MATWHDTIQVWKPLDKNLTQCEWIEEDDFYLEYSKSEMKKLSPSLPYLFSSLVSSCYGSDYNFYREFYSLNFTYKAVYHKKSLALYGMDRTLINKIKLRPFSSVKALTFSNDSRYICLGQEEDIEIFDTKELKQLKILKSHEKKITALATSADNRYLVSTALDQTLKLWSLENFELITTIESGFTQKITAVSFSMDSTQILVSSQEGIKVWDVKTKEALFHLFNDEEFWCLLDGEEELIEKGVIRDEIAKVTKSC
ncbi:WD-40 repeat protein [hydrothermal vent metagenome]|uniref:WD-40 repeat protein n=1 Tax=hydrothermal vent metagenome TaxID=652676 RepID=A0A1W1CZ66_9ZZZZ